VELIDICSRLLIKQVWALALRTGCFEGPCWRQGMQWAH
jgi:hypothetical protein